MYMARERRRYILRLLEQRGSLRSAELARELGVTDETIRTDLVALQERGLLQRVHGGARYRLPDVGNPYSLSERLDSALAQLVLPHLKSGCTLYPDPGNFARVLIVHLGNLPCTVIAASPGLLRLLAPKAQPQRLVCAGGLFDKESAMTEDTGILELYPPDVAVLSPAAVTPQYLAYRTARQAEWAQHAIRKASLCIVAVPSAALGVDAPHRISNGAHLLLTEDNLPPGFDTMAVQTVPYISADDVTQPDSFDY